MKNGPLFSKFSQAINWNAALYIIYKTTFTIQSFMLYASLTVSDFSLWANLNSIIYLLLLWLDFGLRKSIPRYAPEFNRNQSANWRFTRGIIFFQFIVLCLALPLFIYLIINLGNSISYSNQGAFLWLASGVFVTAGLTALARLLYHAHFLNKEFNLLATAATLCQLIIDMIIITTCKTSTTILTSMLATKTISSSGILIGCIIMRKKIIKSNSKNPTVINSNKISKSFIKHSAIMWINNNLKSISERNFLVLLLTYIIGPAQANIFKVANDGALLFYRAIIKTIDTSDTVLLAHIELEKKGQKLTAIAFKKIITKIASLTFPLLGIVALIGIHGVENYHSSFVFQAFIIMTCGYLVETLCMPYERILEVKRRYGYLTLAYIPYIVMLLFLFTNSVIPSIGLLIALGLIHTVRLVSLMIMVFFARSLYHVPFPFIFVLKITSISLIGLSVGYFILTYMVPHDYERVIFYLFPSIR